LYIFTFILGIGNGNFLKNNIYADDFVCCFQSEAEANNFYHDLILRLKKFNLEISEDKAKIMPFGKYAEQNNKQKGKVNQKHLSF